MRRSLCAHVPSRPAHHHRSCCVSVAGTAVRHERPLRVRAVCGGGVHGPRQVREQHRLLPLRQRLRGRPVPSRRTGRPSGGRASQTRGPRLFLRRARGLRFLASHAERWAQEKGSKPCGRGDDCFLHACGRGRLWCYSRSVRHARPTHDRCTCSTRPVRSPALEATAAADALPQTGCVIAGSCPARNLPLRSRQTPRSSRRRRTRTSRRASRACEDDGAPQPAPDGATA